ncbi:unnamed protein product [Urochloa decumbens]|uniref:F-box domain-containing protein n=1 Tax=Urochloa decumbens TaxID=240449 RepID=A0ABC9E6A0_9POAL
MAGRSDRRRPGSTSAAASEHSSSPSFSCSREVAVVQTMSEKVYKPVSVPSSTSVPQGWADLPDDLLQSIIVLLRSPHETLAFAATCRPWHSAFVTSLASNLFALFPPLLLQPKLPDGSIYPEFFIDLMNPAAPLRCQFPWGTVDKMDYIGYSHGNLIYSHKKKCHLFDAFTGTRTKSPRLVLDKREYPIFGALTAPLASPDSSLFVQAGRSLYEWKIGSEAWLEQYRVDLPIIQVASFKGEIVAMDYRGDLFRVRLEPRFTVQKLDVAFEGYIMNPTWLVVCDDTLLLVGHWENSFHVAWLDLSSGPKWIKVERLENWAVFVAPEGRSQAFACKNPERWGGRSNCIYFCGINEPLGVVQLGETVEPLPDHMEASFFCRLRHSEERSVDASPAIWVFPGVFSRSQQRSSLRCHSLTDWLLP